MTRTLPKNNEKATDAFEKLSGNCHFERSEKSEGPGARAKSHPPVEMRLCLRTLELGRFRIDTRSEIAENIAEDLMTVLHGFEQISQQMISEIDTDARLYRHLKTGAELLSLVRDDENKVFGITFRTPPQDSTGVAHILEHSVLCGSRKYPVKEPFVELLKGSLKTFLNAFTYPDKTCYPVASQNLQDFYNLIDVYLDAVFYPRLTPLIFQQEGWHLELEEPDDPLTFKGVVYNEMKGAYSSPDTVLSEYSQQSLFPDNTYGLDSGGEPGQILNLTFEQFQEFHRKYYHPSNARIFFYGDDDPQKRLHIINEYLKDFDRLEINSSVGFQSKFEEPKRIERAFSVGKDEGSEADSTKGMLTVNWLLSETTDPELNLALHVLEYILLGMPGSPLRKALIDSGLGEALAGVGLEAELRQMYFSTGLKGMDITNADRIESLVFDTLNGLVKSGISQETIEAALNTTEFRLRENNTGSFPRGLLLMLRALTTWLHDSDPMLLLSFEGPLSSIKSSASADNKYFENLIQRYLIENSHRTTLVMRPDPNLEEKQKEAESERLTNVRKHMHEEQLKLVIEHTRTLRQMQEAPDPPEALATIPTLTIDDLDKKNKITPIAQLEKNGVKILYHDLFTNGIVYLDAGFDLISLPQQYLQFMPLFTRTLIEMGTESEDYVAFSQRISSKTGGIRPELFTSTVKNVDTSAVWFFLRGKAMPPQAGEMLAILQDMLLNVKLDQRDRFRQMVLEEKARQEQKLVPAGHQMVNLRLRSHFKEADWVAEQMNGVSYLMFVRKLARMVEENWDEVLQSLREIRRILFKREMMILNVTLDDENWKTFESLLDDFLTSIPSQNASVEPADWQPEHAPPFEGMVIPTQVNYVGKGTNIYSSGYHFHGSTLVVSRYLRNSWLWERIRVQGGAYGAFCLFDRLSGTLSFVSYRDPNLLKTLENFDQTAEFLRTLKLSEEELTKAIIGTIGDLDSYMLPDAKGYASLLRHLSGDSDEDRQKMRDEVLATTAVDFRAFADILDVLKEKGIIKVLGSQSAIEESLVTKDQWLEVLKVL